MLLPIGFYYCFVCSCFVCSLFFCSIPPDVRVVAIAHIRQLDELRKADDGLELADLPAQISAQRDTTALDAAALTVNPAMAPSAALDIAAPEQVADLNNPMHRGGGGGGAGGSETSNPLRKERRATSSRRAGVSKRDSSRSSESGEHDPVPRGSIVVPIVGRLEPLASPCTVSRCVLQIFLLFDQCFFVCAYSLFTSILLFAFYSPPARPQARARTYTQARAKKRGRTRRKWTACTRDGLCLQDGLSVRVEAPSTMSSRGCVATRCSLLLLYTILFVCI